MGGGSFYCTLKIYKLHILKQNKFYISGVVYKDSVWKEGKIDPSMRFGMTGVDTSAESCFGG